jgi:quercetin dioxygenase-like cupin family protein
MISPLSTLMVVLILLIGATMPVAAKGHDKATFAVYHGPVAISLADAASDGHQLGDLRVTTVATTTAEGEPVGRLDATLTTTGIDVPEPGDEIRISTLVFSFDDEAGSQIVVSGSAAYPAEGPTIATGDTTVRPIVGGSGAFAGATGDAVTTHLGDDHWIHTFEFGNGKSHAPKRGGAAKARQAPKGKDAIDAGVTTRADRTSSAEVGITRTDLGIAEPATAPGLELGLWHYVIPAGSELAPHTHPGWQIARIAQGELTYTIIAGEGTLISEDGSSQPVGPGTYMLKVGDSIVENPDLEHYGTNDTSEPVTILAATLYTQGAPLSLPLEPAASTAPEASLDPAA